MLPRSIAENAINAMTLRYVSERSTGKNPKALADLYVETSEKIRERIEATTKIDEDK